MSDSMLNLNPPDSGVLLIVSGPSGAGKSTLLSAAMERVPGLSFSVSATTRSMRAGEVEGEGQRESKQQLQRNHCKWQ